MCGTVSSHQLIRHGFLGNIERALGVWYPDKDTEPDDGNPLVALAFRDYVIKRLGSTWSEILVVETSVKYASSSITLQTPCVLTSHLIGVPDHRFTRAI